MGATKPRRREVNRPPRRSRPRAVGKSQVHYNLNATSTKLLQGEPLRVISQKVDLRGRTLH